MSKPLSTGVFTEHVLIIFGLAVGPCVPAAMSLIYTLCVLGKCFVFEECTENVIQLVLEVIQAESRNQRSIVQRPKLTTKKYSQTYLKNMLNMRNFQFMNSMGGFFKRGEHSPEAVSI